MRRVSNPILNQEEDKKLDLTLRPKSLAEFIGQEKVKKQLDILIKSAKLRSEQLDHILLYGPPGLGKTTLAYILAHEFDTNIKITSGPTIEKSGDLAAILTNLEENDILFIDEIHRLPKAVEEMLYLALEDFVIDLIVGKGPGARTLRIDLNRFTLIGATTKISLLSGPLRDRFGAIYHFDFYQIPELQSIINRSSKILNIAIDTASSEEIAKRSRRTPRVANRLLKRIRDYALVEADSDINLNTTKEALKILDVDEYGLDVTDRLILFTIIDKFNGGPVGLNTIAACTAEEVATIEDVYEPFLIQMGFLHRTPKGRVVTELAYKHLNISLGAIY